MDSGIYLEVGDKVKYKNSYFTVFDKESEMPIIEFGPVGSLPKTVQLKEGDFFQLEKMAIMLVKIQPPGFLFNIPDYYDKIEIERQNRQLLEVYIYLPDADPYSELKVLENIQNKVGDFVNEFGFEYYPEHDPIEIYGSWQWKSWFKRNKPMLKREVTEVYDEMREALRVQQIDVHSAEVFNKRATAAKDVILALADYDEGIIRLGDVYVVKAILDGKKRILVENITPKVARELEKNPSLLLNPNEFFQFISDGQGAQSICAKQDELKSLPQDEMKSLPNDNPIEAT